MNQGLTYELDAVMPAVAQTGLQASLCSILARPTTGGQPTVNALGQVDQSVADYTPFLSNIPCQLSVYRSMRPDLTAVTRKQEEFDTRPEFIAELNDFYPGILASPQHIAVINGTTYQIMTPAESDSQSQVTRLALRTYNL